MRVASEYFLRGVEVLSQVGCLTKEQVAIGIVGIRLLLTGCRMLRGFAGGDFMKRLVYTAIWTANVKHVTNTTDAGDRGILEDSQRQPVSVMAISDALLKEAQCVRVGRKGLVVMARTHRRHVPTTAAAYDIVMSFPADLRNAGVKA